MAFVRQRYGKANVRLLRVHRGETRHEVREVRVTVTLDGDFARAYTAADNRAVVPTDTIRNLVNVLALEHLEAANEPFALAVAQRLLDRYQQVSEARVEVEESAWSRLRIDGRPQQHSFVRAEGGTPFAQVAVTRSSREIRAGIRDCTIMKTTESGFVDYLQDEYTTLAPTTDRILATRLCATWRFADAALPADFPAVTADAARPADSPAVAADAARPADCTAVADAIRAALLRVFATTYSYSVQDSLYRMGEAALAAAPAITEITLEMPNLHYLPLDLSPFGRDAAGKLFLPTDEPGGRIEATLRRE